MSCLFIKSTAPTFAKQKKKKNQLINMLKTEPIETFISSTANQMDKNKHKDRSKPILKYLLFIYS